MVRSWLEKNWHYLLVTFVSTALLISLFDVSWWAKDEGVFAHLAERVLAGEVIGVDVLDFHGGYHSLLNALMFHWFGVDLVVLRYPLILLGIIQAVLVTYLLRECSKKVAIMGGVTSVIVGFLQFPNPSPNWYALFFAVAVVAILMSKKRSIYHLLSIGLLMGLCFMFRHPSAIFLSFGVATFLVHESRGVLETFYNRWLSIGLLLSMAVAVVLYSTLVFEPLAFVLFGMPPLVLLASLLRYRAFDFQKWFYQLIYIGSGALVAVVPMVVYQFLYGNVGVWFHTAFLSGNSIVEKEFFHNTTYINSLYIYTVHALAKGSTALAFLEIGYWILILITPLIACVLLLWNIQRDKNIPAVAIVTPFYGLVSFYFQIPFYFFISFILYVVAIFVLLPKTKTLQQVAFSTLVFVSVWCLVSLTPGFQALVQPQVYTESTFGKSSIRLEVQEIGLYEEYISYVHAHTTDDDLIYAFPFDPEMYFLTDRKNPFPHIGSSFAVNSEESFEQFLIEFNSVSPKMVIFNQQHMYESIYDEKLFSYLQESKKYEQTEIIGEYLFFVRVTAIEL